MNVLSTRGQAPAVSLSQAIAAGLAPDGGLYMPEHWPQFSTTDFDGLNTLPEIALRLLQPFFAGEILESALPDICQDALSIQPPLVPFGHTGDYLL
jgi:threonine synthase